MHTQNNYHNNMNMHGNNSMNNYPPNNLQHQPNHTNNSLFIGTLLFDLFLSPSLPTR